MREVQRDADDAIARNNEPNDEPDNEPDNEPANDAEAHDNENANEIGDPNEVTTDAADTDAAETDAPETDAAETNADEAEDDDTSESNGDEDDEPNLAQQIQSDDENADTEASADHVDAKEVRRSERVSKPVSWYEPNMNNKDYNADNFITQVLHHASYDTEYALMMAKVIMQCRDKRTNAERGASFAETYSLKKGIRILGERGEKAASDEVTQLHLRGCFNPIDVTTLSKEESDRVLESLIFLTEKRDGSTKARTCVNGSKQRLWTDKEDSASPTVLLESVMITSVIDAKEGRDVAIIDIPNAFVQTEMEGERVVMKMRGKLAELLVEIAPEVYRDYVVIENGQTVIYLELLKALYGMLQSALLFYRKLRKDLEGVGFTVNPYDPCVANKMVEGSQMTVVWHVDDMKISHVKKKCVDEMIEWSKSMYEDKVGKVKQSRGKIHDYLGMEMDFSSAGEVQIKMVKYVKDMVSCFPDQASIQKEVVSPASDSLFRIRESPKLSRENAEIFHNIVAKGLFVAKRARPDIMVTIAFLCTRVREPTDDDWTKLIRLLRYLNGTSEFFLTLSADNTNIIRWYGDASFAVHQDMKSHTGGVMTMGSGGVINVSRKQKMVSKSSMEAELIAGDDIANTIIWANYFLEAQGYRNDGTKLLQDNKSCMLLHNNGKASSSKRTRHLNIRYYFLADRIANGELTVEFCPTDDMIADYLTKPLQGEKFRKFRKFIMNLRD